MAKAKLKKVKRYVAYSERLGAFMGVWDDEDGKSGDCWTKATEGLAASMHHLPTFSGKEEFVKFFKKHLPKVAVPRVEMVNVKADRAGKRASEDSCVAAGLERWTS